MKNAQDIGFYNQLKATHPTLMIVGWLHLILGIICLCLMGFDDRTLLGVNVWLKPMKFAFSLFIFIWTVAWWLSIYPYSEKWKKWLGYFFALFAIAEIAVITLQASRGVQSHYNTTTPLDGTLFAIMGISIYSMMTITVMLAFHAFTKQLKTSKAVTWSIRFSWLAMLAAFAGGQIMINNLKHNVGIPDGGVGLPLTNWSTEGGDLRIMHFFGMHGMQLLPFLVGVVLPQFIQDKSKRITMSIIIGMGYLLFVLFLWWQAMNGRPLFKV